MEKCKFPDGITIKPDGINPMDPCEYEVIEEYKNVSIEVLRCKKCGHVEVSWSWQEDTEKLL